MMKKRIGRLLSWLLILALAAGMLPAVTLRVDAALGDRITEEMGQMNRSVYIDLPITVRNYRNDGMLFEMADYRAETATVTRETVLSSSTETTVRSDAIFLKNASGDDWYDTNSSGQYGIRVYSQTYAEHPWDNPGFAFYFIGFVCKSDGSIVQKFGSATDKEGVVTSVMNAHGSGAYTVWVYVGDGISSIYNDLDITTTKLVVSGNTLTVRTKGNVQRQTYYMGNNAAFGFFKSNEAGTNTTDPTPFDHHNADHVSAAYGGNNYGVIPAISEMWSASASGIVSGWGVTEGPKYDLAQTAVADQYGGITIGLVEPTLGTDKKPTYNKYTVFYLARLLANALPIHEKASNGYYNYNFIKGEPDAARFGTDANGNARDFAAYLRTVIRTTKNNFDTDAECETQYQNTLNRNLSSDWNKAKNQILTHMDAAYWMLENLYSDNGVSDTVKEYSTLRLYKETKADGTSYYAFDGGYDNVQYNANTGIISNQTGANTKRMIAYAEDGSGNDMYTTLTPFLPIQSGLDEYIETKSPYFMDAGVTSDLIGGTYTNRDFNYVIEGHGDFVYNSSENLYFNFEGDDDVYLFINGKLALDIGGAHGLTGMKLNLNDYNALLTGSDKLQDGQLYDFDFYYMERHGYGANIRIETNIQVKSKNVAAEKGAYLGDTKLINNAMITDGDVLDYYFTLINDGGQTLQSVNFIDDDIGLYIGSNMLNSGIANGGLGTYTTNGQTINRKASDLTVEFYFADTGETVQMSSNSINTVEKLQTLCSNLHITYTRLGQTVERYGLKPGDKMTIKGIKYCLTEQDKANITFTNTVHIIAGTARASADFTVKIGETANYYAWKGKTLSVSVDDLLKQTNATSFGNKYLEINLCDAAGDVGGIDYKNEVRLIPNAEAGHLSAIKLNYNTTGIHIAYFSLYIPENPSLGRVVIALSTRVYDVADNTYVLDYGLPVELNEYRTGASLLANDTLSLTGVRTGTYLLGITGMTPSWQETSDDRLGMLQGSYDGNTINFSRAADGLVEAAQGDYLMNVSSGSVTFTPDDFMDTESTAYVAVRVSEMQTGVNDIVDNDRNKKVDIHTGVDMFQKITVVPASVVYYEDDFVAIDYSENQNTMEQDDSNNAMQSADQNSQYGQDGSYEASGVDSSENSTTVIHITQSGVVGRFAFKGTGFELLSRTTSIDAASIVVRVYDASEELVKVIPVIMEYDNAADDSADKEAVYQVPVISVRDLTYGDYTVTISAVVEQNLDGWTTGYVVVEGVAYITMTNTTTGAQFRKNLTTGNWEQLVNDTWTNYGKIPPNVVETTLYIDGVRIYDPMGNNTDYYLSSEANATIVEVRKLLMTGQATIVEHNATDGLLTANNAGTFVENRNGDFEKNSINSLDQILAIAPNNEIYLNGLSLSQGVAFYVKPEAGAADATVQIGVHAVDIFAAFGQQQTETSAELLQGYWKDGGYVWNPIKTVTSGTEQYYIIDPTIGPMDDKLGYLVVLRANSDILSITNVKYNGYTIPSGVWDAATATFGDNGVLQDVETIESLSLLSEMMGADTVEAWQAPVVENLVGEIVIPKIVLPDIAGTWYEEDVQWMCDAGIITGDGGLFHGDRKVTREEFITMVVRALDLQAPADYEQPFTDAAGRWSEQYIAAAAANGLLQGTTPTTCSPDQVLTREQLMTFIARIMEQQGLGNADGADLSHFTDAASISDWAYDSVAMLVAEGLVLGRENNTLAPRATCTRAESATLLCRLLKTLQED